MQDRAISAAYGIDAAGIALINVSENETLRIDMSDGERLIWRRYRAGSRSLAQIEAELDWMAAILRETEISVPAVIPARDGRRIVVDGEGRQHVLFSFLEGSAPPEDDLVPWFARLGAVSARLHHHGRTHMEKAKARPHYDYDGLIGAAPVWGRWQDAPGLAPREVAMVARAAERVREKLAALDGDARSLIHGDLRLANLLVDGGNLHVIDFDDCGIGWRLFDLATALSLIEDVDDAPAAAMAWLDNYEKVQRLPADERAVVPDLIMLRRIQVMAWFATHPDTELCVTHGRTAIAASISAADQYLAGRSPFIQ